jgi:hypothetical protein
MRKSLMNQSLCPMPARFNSTVLTTISATTRAALLSVALLGGVLLGATGAIAEPPDEGFTPDFVLPPLTVQDWQDLGETSRSASALRGTQTMAWWMAFPPTQPPLVSEQSQNVGGSAEDLQFTSPVLLDTRTFNTTAPKSLDARMAADLLFPVEPKRSSAKLWFSLP